MPNNTQSLVRRVRFLTVERRGKEKEKWYNGVWRHNRLMLHVFLTRTKSTENNLAVLSSVCLARQATANEVIAFQWFYLFTKPMSGSNNSLMIFLIEPNSKRNNCHTLVLLKFNPDWSTIHHCGLQEVCTSKSLGLLNMLSWNKDDFILPAGLSPVGYNTTGIPSS